jgi:predicted enzyme related to lactoylglutathione lyase
VPELLINIDVDDLDRAEAFYTLGFDLEVGRRFGGAVELLGANAPVYLLAKPAGTLPFTGAPAPRAYQRHWTPVHLDFVVQDLDAALARAVDAGALLEGEVQERTWGRLALLSDPFGNGLCLLQFLKGGYDELLEVRVPAEVLELALRGAGVPAEASAARARDPEAG